MIHKPLTPSGAYRLLRDQLGSIRKVYLRGNRVTRHDDFSEHDEHVLLLHGFFQTRNVWEVMEDRLRYDGYGVFSFDLGGLFWRYNTRSITDLSAMIADKIEGICERHSLDRFHVIGHSKGGIIARHYIQKHGGDRRAKCLITLGSPHHGTPTALLAVPLMAGGLLSRSPLDMLPNSPLVRLLARDSFPAGIPFTSIYSKSDVVCPWWASHLRPRPGESSMKNVPIRDVGHTALTHDPALYHIIRRELEAATALWRDRSELAE